MNKDRVLFLEFIFFFIGVPLFLILSAPISVKIGIVLLTITRLIYLVHQMGVLSWQVFKPDHPVPKWIWLRFSAFVLLSTIWMYQFHLDLFFQVVLTKPLLWLIILFIYTFLSVLPQEWLYRFVYEKRYGHLLPQSWTGVILNGLIFSLAHIMFYNFLVLVLTFLGGCLFYHTYKKYDSLYLASVEHTLYGLWLFTLGMGDMLAFPS